MGGKCATRNGECNLICIANEKKASRHISLDDAIGWKCMAEWYTKDGLGIMGWENFFYEAYPPLPSLMINQGANS